MNIGVRDHLVVFHPGEPLAEIWKMRDQSLCSSAKSTSSLTRCTFDCPSNLVTVRGTLAGGDEVSVSGTLAGSRHVGVGDFDVDLVLTEHMACLRYGDRPGIVGIIGRILDDAGINIADMQVARTTESVDTLVALTVDGSIPHPVLAEFGRWDRRHLGPRGQLGGLTARFAVSVVARRLSEAAGHGL